MYTSERKVSKRTVGRKMNQAINGNRKLCWKEASNAKGEKVESCTKIKDGSGRMVQGENEV